MLTWCVVWVAHFDTVHPAQNTHESWKQACEIKNDEANMPSIITGPCFYYFFPLLICHCVLTSESDFYGISPEYVIGRKSPSQCSQSKKNGNVYNKKTSEHAAWSSRKMSLSVTLSVWSYIRIRRNIFLWYKRMQLSSSRITVQFESTILWSSCNKCLIVNFVMRRSRCWNRADNKTFFVPSLSGLTVKKWWRLSQVLRPFIERWH